MVLVILIFFADRATVFTLSKTFETVQTKILRRFFAMKSGAGTIKHIYFVSLDIHLYSSILTHRYLWTGPYVAPFFFFFIDFLSYKQHFATFYVSHIYNKYNKTVVSIHAGFLTRYKLEGKSLFFVYIGVLVVHSS
jgi:hypothetical protein